MYQNLLYYALLLAIMWFLGLGLAPDAAWTTMMLTCACTSMTLITV